MLLCIDLWGKGVLVFIRATHPRDMGIVVMPKIKLPYMRDIMNSIDEEATREIIVNKGAAIGPSMSTMQDHFGIAVNLMRKSTAMIAGPLQLIVSPSYREVITQGMTGFKCVVIGPGFDHAVSQRIARAHEAVLIFESRSFYPEFDESHKKLLTDRLKDLVMPATCEPIADDGDELNEKMSDAGIRGHKAGKALKALISNRSHRKQHR